MPRSTKEETKATSTKEETKATKEETVADPVGDPVREATRKRTKPRKVAIEDPPQNTDPGALPEETPVVVDRDEAEPVVDKSNQEVVDQAENEEENTGVELGESEDDVEDDEGLFDDDSTDFEEDDDVEWPASTVMYLPRIIDEKLLAYFKKYVAKDSNRGRLFRPSTTMLVDDEQQDELDELEEIEDETFRKCQVARDTQTLQKLYNMLEKTIDEATDKFIEKFNFFNIVSTKEEYTLLRFDPGDFHKEHVECSSLTDESDGSSRRICVYLILETPKRGGHFDFTYQGTRIIPEAGSVLMFPSCPLHPVKLTKVVEGSLMMVTNYLL